MQDWAFDIGIEHAHGRWLGLNQSTLEAIVEVGASVTFTL